ncbi:OmpA family protein, partial [Acidithiobacillus thiooxidans]
MTDAKDLDSASADGPVFGASAIAQGAMPGTNLPFLQPYPGSTMEGYVTRQYDELRMPLGPFKTDQSQMQQWPVKSQMVAGQAVYIRYETPKDRSPFEIMSNYRETLQKEGFHVLWQCVSKQCVVGGDTKPSVDRDPVWPVSDRSFGTYFFNNDGRMLTARLDSGNSAQTWVYLWVGGPSNADGGTTRVYAVQTKPMHTGLVQGSSELLTAAAMGQALGQQGRFAMHLPFDYNRATLRPDAMAQIRQLAQALQSHPNWQIGLDGHTDAVGGAAFNQKLSEERAAAVKTALLRLGVPATQVAT